jgi:hypothetical protein
MFRLALLSLLFTAAPVAGEQLTIRCERNGDFDFSTFDTVTKRMIVEVTGRGTYRGKIQATSDGEIQFLLLFPGRMQTN